MQDKAAAIYKLLFYLIYLLQDKIGKSCLLNYLQRTLDPGLVPSRLFSRTSMPMGFGFYLWALAQKISSFTNDVS
jgi:hypothetical protein